MSWATIYELGVSINAARGEGELIRIRRTFSEEYLRNILENNELSCFTVADPNRRPLLHF